MVLGSPLPPSPPAQSYCGWPHWGEILFPLLCRHNTIADGLIGYISSSPFSTGTIPSWMASLGGSPFPPSLWAQSHPWWPHQGYLLSPLLRWHNPIAYGQIGGSPLPPSPLAQSHCRWPHWVDLLFPLLCRNNPIADGLIGWISSSPFSAGTISLRMASSGGSPFSPSLPAQSHCRWPYQGISSSPFSAGTFPSQMASSGGSRLLPSPPAQSNHGWGWPHWVDLLYPFSSGTIPLISPTLPVTWATSYPLWWQARSVKDLRYGREDKLWAYFSDLQMRNEEAQDLLDLWDLWEFGQRKPHLYTCKWVCTEFLQFTAPSSLEVWQLEYSWLWNIPHTRVLCKLHDSWIHDQETWAVMCCQIFFLSSRILAWFRTSEFSMNSWTVLTTNLLINCINYTYFIISNIWPMTLAPTIEHSGGTRRKTFS